MSICPSVLRKSGWLVRDATCVFCRHRSVQPLRRYATRNTTKYRLDPSRTPQEIRNDIDKRNRNAYFRMLQADKLLPCGLEDASKIVNQFMINQKNNLDPATNARELAKQYKLKVIHLPMLAIPLFRVPDVNDTTAQLPPSQQAHTAAAILLACSAAGDVQATLQILNAIYYSKNGYNIPQAAEIARFFSPSDINNCMLTLEKLAGGDGGNAGPMGDANAMTLHGKFLELAGKRQEAKNFYEKALGKYDTKIHRGYPHPMALPWLTPWMELVMLERSQREPSLVSIKEALEFGALKADDPMAYYQLALFQQKRTPSWLAYMSKAAASGHSEAMFTLGHFYLSVNEKPASYLKAGFQKALNFMTNWKHAGPADLAMDWFRAAALGGHKPAMMEIAELHAKSGAAPEFVKNCLRDVLQAPPKGKQEEWPHLVTQAQRQLAAM